jgi:hypothetical protein
MEGRNGRRKQRKRRSADKSYSIWKEIVRYRMERGRKDRGERR